MPSSDAIRKLELSPAQIGRYTEAVDVWAVGILCFECLSGKLHHSAHDALQRAHATRTDDR